MTQNNLGNALAMLGERESGTARLEEAVTAYREALKEETRARAPLLWAGAQMNLGTALQTLGERESGTERLDEAVTAFREALQEYTRARVPLQGALEEFRKANADFYIEKAERQRAELLARKGNPKNRAAKNKL
jgi:exonuclease VII small subunit